MQARKYLFIQLILYMKQNCEQSQNSSMEEEFVGRLSLEDI